MAKKTGADLTVPDDNFKQLLADQLFDVTRQMRADLSKRLQKLDLYGGQERIILLLRDKDGLAPGTIASELGVSPPTVAKSINRLAASGLVVRRTDKNDRRRASVHLTTLGHSLVKKIKKEQKKWVKAAFDGLKSSERKAVSAYLERILENLQNIQ